MAVNQIAPLIPNDHRVQVDAHEVMTYILELLPHDQQMRIQERTTYTVDGHPIEGNPAGLSQKEERYGCISLSIPEGEANPTLEGLLRHYCDDRTVIERKSVDGQNRPYPAVIERRFLEMPSVLRFQIKRFYNEELPKSWLTNVLSWVWPKLGYRMVKRDVPVQVPDTLSIAAANGERRQYRLVSFVNHHGPSIGSGHYTADVRVNDARDYHISDEVVNLVDRSTRDALREQAYLFCYVPVPA
jgi:hypothetical protein